MSLVLVLAGALLGVGMKHWMEPPDRFRLVLGGAGMLAFCFSAVTLLGGLESWMGLSGKTYTASQILDEAALQFTFGVILLALARMPLCEDVAAQERARWLRYAEAKAERMRELHRGSEGQAERDILFGATGAYSDIAEVLRKADRG